MYKISTRILFKPHCYRTKFLMVMKLTSVLLMAAILQVSAATYGQKITLSARNIALENAIKKIRQQSGYNFLYEDTDLANAKAVNIDFSNVSLNEALEKLFANQQLSYSIKDKTVVIKSNQSKPLMAGVMALVDIRGKVLDTEGKPLPGANVRVKDGTKGATTNTNGEFELKGIDPKSTLIVSYIGYVNKEIAVGTQTQFNIYLESDLSKLNEVVVIGYGTVKRSDLTGSVGQVNISDFQQAPVRSFDEALAGRVAGLQVTSSEGQPGSGIDIIIRGTNSITQDNSPLYVIDGFPIDNFDNNAINPAEIESIDVLKDASATAIYGARGANGVIMITTKRGKIGLPTIRYNGSYGIQNNVHQIPLMSPYEYLKLQSEINATDFKNAYLGPIPDPVDPTDPPIGYKYTLEDYRNTQGIDWQSQLFRTAPMLSNSLSVSGGTDKTRYSLSGQLFSQDGTIINSGFRRQQVKMTLDQTVNSKLKVGADLTYTSSKTFGSATSTASGSSMNNFLYSVWGYRPVTPIGVLPEEVIEEDTDEYVSAGTDYRFNPIMTAKNQLRQTFARNFIGNGYAEYAFIPELRLKVTGGLNRVNRRAESFNNSNTYSGSPSNPFSNGPNGSIVNYETTTWSNENILTYDKKFGKNHRLTAVGAFSLTGNKYLYYGLSANALPNEALGLSGLSSGTPQPVTSYSSEWSMVSVLSRINYSYKGKYLLTLSYRNDGSSKFAPGNQWSDFPSGAVAWKLINENFMKKLSFLSEAKLRASFGATGNNRVGDGDRFAQMTYPIASSYSFNNTLVPGIHITNVGSPDLRWETTKQVDAGLDLGFFKDRIALTVDYYRKNTTDLLLNAQLPYTSGYGTAFKNIGATRNEGFEFSLNTSNIQNDNFSWTTSFNIAFNKNKVMELTENQESLTSTVSWDSFYSAVPLYIAKLGQPIGQIYGYIWDGVYQLEDFTQPTPTTYLLKPEITTNGNARASIRPGDIKYRDINGDGVVNDFDRTIIGRGYPIHQGGMTNNFRYKNFDLSVFFQWSYGNDIINANKLVFEAGNKAFLNQFASYQDRWTPENTNTTMHRPGGQYGYNYSTRIVEDGSFLRLKTAALGYTLPKSALKQLKIKSLRLYASAQNLYTWTNYTGIDPEVNVKRTALTPGFDYSAYPRARTITFGANLSF
ncbi:TonB-linked SusC/RagA family outer membrane protein [Pedobacter africanus]